MQYLRAIVECTGSVLVLSSAWQVTDTGRQEVDAWIVEHEPCTRDYRSLPCERKSPMWQVDLALARWSIPPCVARTTTNSHAGGGEERRAREIMTWIKQHPQAVSSGYIVLDDLDLDSVAAPPSWEPVIPRGHFLRISDQTGLTKADAARAIASRLADDRPPPPRTAHVHDVADCIPSMTCRARSCAAQCLVGAIPTFRRYRSHSRMLTSRSSGANRSRRIRARP